MNAYRDRGLLPDGLRDDLPPLAGFEAELTERIMRRVAAHGYERVKPPLVEFEDTLLTGPGAAVADQMFRLMDPVSQRMMGVRPDMTLQVARIATTRLRDLPRPLRLSYAGQVLRVRGDQLRPDREIRQVGAELVGVAAPEGDVEVISLAVAALRDLGVANPSVDLSLPSLVPLICAALDLPAERAAVLRATLDRKDAVRLAETAADLPVLHELIAAAGSAETAIAGLRRIDLPGSARAACDELERVVAELGAAWPDLGITVDPVECRGFEYHAGLSFAFFSRGTRGELGRGGRYLLEDGEPATGFTMYLDSLLRALPPAAPTDCVFLPAGTGRGAADRLRAEGWRTVQGLGPVDDPAAEARRLRCTHVLSGGAVVAVAGV